MSEAKTSPHKVSSANDRGVFKLKTVFILIFVGVFSFGAFFTIAGFSDSFRNLNNGQSHAASKSPNGFAGIYRLAQGHGINAELKRMETDWEDNETLTVHTLSRIFLSKQVEEINPYTPTLIVLPKWRTGADRENFGRTMRYGVFDAESVGDLISKFDEDLKVSRLAKDESAGVTFAKPGQFETAIANAPAPIDMAKLGATNIERLQSFTSEEFEPIISSDDGMVLGKLTDRQVYVLSDPDIFNNAGIKDFETARLGLAALDYMVYDTEADVGRYVEFDLINHGLGSNQNLIKIMLTPPFLAATMCLLALGALIAWRAFTRFGAPETAIREYALGKQALADNSAALIKMAGREPAMARRYAELIKQRIVKTINAPRTLTDKNLVETLDRMGERAETTHRYSDLSAASANIQDNEALMKSARNLHNWKQEITHGRD